MGSEEPGIVVGLFAACMDSPVSKQSPWLGPSEAAATLQLRSVVEMLLATGIEPCYIATVSSEGE